MFTDSTEWAHVGWGFWGWWVLASTVGLAVGFAVALAVGAVVGEAVGFAMTLAVGGAVLGASLGITQWLILRRQVSRAGWWVLASIVGLPVSLGGAVSGVMGVSVSLGGDAAWAAVASGLAGYGAITGAVLVWLSRQPTAKELKQLGLAAIRPVVVGVVLGVGLVGILFFIWGGPYIGGVIAAYVGAPINVGMTIGFFAALGYLWLFSRHFSDRLVSYFDYYWDLFTDLLKD